MMMWIYRQIIEATKKNAEIVIDANEEVDQDVNAEKTKNLLFNKQ
jgi:hypothetical protein